MKIVLIGGSSTGKTTVFNHLYNLRITTNYIQIDARRLLQERGIDNLDNLNNGSFLSFQNEIFRQRELLEKEYNDFLSDRSFIDGIAYLKSKGYDINKYIQKYLPYINEYDYVFYFPTQTIPFEANSFRAKSIDFNESVDNNIRDILQQYNIKYFPLNMPSIDERITYIKAILYHA